MDKEALKELKLITLEGDHYFGTYDNSMPEKKKLYVIPKQGNFLKNWFMANNVNEVREIIIYGDSAIQVESLSEEEIVLLEQYYNNFIYAKSKTLSMAENAAFKYVVEREEISDNRSLPGLFSCGSGTQLVTKEW